MLYKEHESVTDVVYKYGPSADQLGRLRFNKTNGDHEQLDAVPNVNSNNFYLFRALTRLNQCRNDDNYPTITSFS